MLMLDSTLHVLCHIYDQSGSWICICKTDFVSQTKFRVRLEFAETRSESNWNSSYVEPKVFRLKKRSERKLMMAATLF